MKRSRLPTTGYSRYAATCNQKLALPVARHLKHLIVIVAALASVGATTLSSNAIAYESKWEGKVCSGCYLKDQPPWELYNGGYHLWKEAEAAHVGGTKVPRICIWAYNGSKWEEGSGCATEALGVWTYFATVENALAQAQGWSYSGGELTMVGKASG